MTTIRPFRCDDLFKFNAINIDHLTETYAMHFYLHYMTNWPELFQVAESADGKLMGYIMGKVEGKSDTWHGHVTAVTVAPTYRRMGLAARLMHFLEHICEKQDAYFVDLFVRVSNTTAIGMYERLGYVVYRRIIDYYSGDGTSPDEDAFDMRKSLSRDPEKKFMVPLKNPVPFDDAFTL